MKIFQIKNSIQFAHRQMAQLSLMAVCTGLSACAVGPSYEAPSPNIDAQWHALVPHNGEPQEVLNWWSQFNDASLTRLQTLAAKNNATLEISRARMMQARASAGMGSAGQFPAVNASGTAMRNKSISTVDGSETLLTNMVGTLDAAWELDLWGGSRARAQGSQAISLASEYDWAASKVSVSAEIASTYTAYRSCQAQSKLMNQDIQSRVSSARLTQMLVNAGFTAPADGALTDAALANARQSQSSVQAQCAILLKNIAVLTGVGETEVHSAISDSDESIVVHAPAFTLSQLPVQIISQRPDVAAAERRLFAANRQITSTKANQFPRLSLLGSMNWLGVRLTGASTTAQSDTWSFGPALSLPIFNAGQLQSATDSARAQYDEALAGYRLSVQNAVREVETALVQLESAHTRMKQAGIASEGFQKFLTASQMRHDAGMISILELEEARRSALGAHLSLINAQQDYTTQWISLYKAIGGEWRTDWQSIQPSLDTQLDTQPK